MAVACGCFMAARLVLWACMHGVRAASNCMSMPSGACSLNRLCVVSATYDAQHS